MLRDWSIAHRFVNTPRVSHYPPMCHASCCELRIRVFEKLVDVRHPTVAAIMRPDWATPRKWRDPCESEEIFVLPPRLSVKWARVTLSELRPRVARLLRRADAPIITITGLEVLTAASRSTSDEWPDLHDNILHCFRLTAALEGRVGYSSSARDDVEMTLRHMRRRIRFVRADELDIPAPSLVVQEPIPERVWRTIRRSAHRPYCCWLCHTPPAISAAPRTGLPDWRDWSTHAFTRTHTNS
jgi:hypothetical protein